MNLQPQFLLVAALLTACSARRTDGGTKTPSQPAAPSDTGSQRREFMADIAYAVPDDVDPSLATLDLYRVDDGTERPLALLIHGGSWVSGDKSAFRQAAPAFVPWFLDRGYTVAAINFRLASPMGQPGDVGPMDQAQDIAHALAWLHEQASSLRISRDPALLVGYSSGAHLVALLGADGRYLEGAGLDPDRVAATVSLDVHAYDVPLALELMVGSDVDQNIPLILHLFGETESEQIEASPIHHVDDRVAPAMLVSVGAEPERTGSHGQIVVAAADNYASALTAAGHHAETVHDAEEDHSSLAIGFGEADDEVTRRVGEFLDRLP